uniref:Uncharacterized protein n=1 Tax=viral metagenome TaxID=1070528 RepID=A0A6C0KZ95_9ZZZZ
MIPLIVQILIDVAVLIYAGTLGVLFCIMSCRCISDGCADAHRPRRRLAAF